MPSNPMVSVVMSVFNGERFLREAMDSILDQRFRDFEFIVVDDGSTDRSASILDSYSKRDPRVTVCHKENSGLIESLNRGCLLAQGKYIARMDADDISVGDRLMWQVDFMEKHPHVAVLGGAVEWIDAEGKSLGTLRHPVEDGEIKSALLHDNVILHPTVIMQREAFVAAGGYRTAVVAAEDYDLWLRIAEHFQLANLEAIVLKYRIHPSQISVTKRRQQTLSALAVQVSASLRRRGIPDPLDSVIEITPLILAGLVITETGQQNELVSGGQKWTRTLCMVSEDSSALKTAVKMLRPDRKYLKRWEIANLYLSLARLYWRQGSFLSSILALGQAVVTRPIVVGRPLKPLLRRLGLVRFAMTR
jgi:glycosyl transferase family 2